MIVTLLIIMLMSTFLVYFFGRFFGKNGSFYLSIASMGICFVYSGYLFVNMMLSQEITTEYIKLCNWIDVLDFSVSWEVLLDNLSITMLFIVLSISFLVHIYSLYYMYNDINSSKFMSYITMFTFFMCILVLSSNFLMLYLGWEGVGLCSFLLISFWNTRVQANKSAIKAMLVNRVGDFFLLIGIVFIAITFKSVDFNIVFSMAHIYSLKPFIVNKYFSLSILDFICFFLIVGAITKSAQFGMHMWLPDATEGPTPVSALIHAATMVTAGIFLIIRCSFMFEFSPKSLTMLVYIGSLTLLLFGLVGMAQFDIKKIIAYSTCSQLGYMMLACGLSGYNLALFHLFTHAWFKALLFLSAGSIIHMMKNEQDIRRLTGIFNKSPLLSVFFIIGSLSLMGVPHLSGYYSKDAIICLAKTYDYNFIIYLSTILGVITTTFYSIRLFYYLFFKKNFSRKESLKTTYNYSTSYSNVIPLTVLSFMSVFGGYLTKVFFIGLGNDSFNGSIFILDHFKLVASELALDNLKSDVVFISILTTVLLVLLYVIKRQEDRSCGKFTYHFFSKDVFLFFNKKMFIDSLINLFVSLFFYELSYALYYVVDKGFLELFGPKGISSLYEKFWFSSSKNIYNGKNWQYLYLICITIFFSLVVLFLLI